MYENYALYTISLIFIFQILKKATDQLLEIYLHRNINKNVMDRL